MSRDSASNPPGLPAGKPKLDVADGLLLLGVLFWGINFPITKELLGVMGPAAYAVVRYGSAALLLLVITLAQGGGVGLSRRDAGLLLLLGGLGVAGFQFFWAAGLDRTTSSNAGLLAGTSPIFGIFFAWVARRRPTRWAVLGIFVAFLGALLVVNNSLTHVAYAGGHWVGDLMCLAAQASWAFYTVLGAGLVERNGAFKVSSYAMLIGSAALLPVAWPQLAAQDWGLFTPTLWGYLGFTTVFAGAGSFLFWYIAVGRIGVARTLPYAYLVPVVAVTASVLMLGEQLTGIQLAGGALILGGIRITRIG
jgi:drug/metabolite transporter (DMT)-like permease